MVRRGREPDAHSRTQNILILVVLGLGALALPFSGNEWNHDGALVHVMLTAMTFAQGITTVLLSQQYLVEGRSHLLVATLVLLWSTLMLATLTAIFPSSTAATTSSPQNDDPTWIWFIWSALFPLALGFVALTWDRWQANLPFSHGQTLTMVVSAGALLSGLFVLSILVIPVPALEDGNTYTAVMREWGQPLVLMCAVIGFTLTWSRRNEHFAGWFAVTNAAIVAGLALAYVGGSRYTVGWYLGRLFVAIASSVVLIGFLTRVWELQREALARSQSLRRQVQRDALTGAISRHGLQDELERLQYSRPAIAILDCDRFKSINDTFGHGTGDEFLAALAGRLQTSLRHDDLLVRWGGDEFLLVINDSPETARQAVERIHREVSSHPIKTKSHLLPVRFSAGVANWGAGETFDSTLQRADRALYASKAHGGGRVTHYRQATVDLRTPQNQREHTR